MEFDVFGNVDNKELDENSILQLSEQRANIIKNMLINAGAKESSITVHVQSNEAPLYTSESSQGQKLNNRADIAVKKLIK